MKKYKKITKCRICGNKNLIPIISLGKQALTGVFPKSKEEKVLVTPLELVKCDETSGKHCGLLQLAHNIDLNIMYGDNYGYRSGLNKSMVRHLREKALKILDTVQLTKGDLVIDIGSNDCTLLKFFPTNLDLVGIDPTGKKFREHYPFYIKLIPDFFSEKLVKKEYGDKKAKVITSIAMFYDLKAPLKFMKEVHNLLADDGIWVFEQSYMPTMLDNVSYDSVCHEHLEFYRLKQIDWMAKKAGFKIINVEFNDVNGGSFSVVVAKSNSRYIEDATLINSLLRMEKEKGLHTLVPYQEFKKKVHEHKKELCNLINSINKEGKKIVGYGASTKGNVILQFCKLTEKDIPFFAEVNEDKFGCFTPQTKIPIINEAEARKMNPDYFIVMPWHFKKMVVEKELEYINKGGKLIFPLPAVGVVEK